MSAIKLLNIKKSKLKQKKVSKNQKQTESTFGYKWAKTDSYDSKAFADFTKKFVFELFCDNDPSQVDYWLKGGEKIILDAGCGSGYSAELLFGKKLNDHHYLGVDISDSIYVGEKRFKELGVKGEFLKANLMDLNFIKDGSIDIIYSGGVLHHTDSTEKAIKYLTKKLKKGGLFLFYVYSKKSVIREFTDDYVRNELQKYSDQKAWEKLYPLTKLGIALGKLNVEIDIPEDIDLLGIKKGKMDIQRFFYWNICKAYYRPEYNLEEMNHLNFDWFRPLNCHRQTPEQLKKWCKEAGLKIENMYIQESGITVIGRKK